MWETASRRWETKVNLSPDMNDDGSSFSSPLSPSIPPPQTQQPRDPLLSYPINSSRTISPRRQLRSCVVAQTHIALVSSKSQPDSRHGKFVTFLTKLSYYYELILTAICVNFVFFPPTQTTVVCFLCFFILAFILFIVLYSDV